MIGMKFQLWHFPSKVVIMYLETNCISFHNSWSLFWASLLAQTVKNPPAIQETSIRSLGCKDALEKGIASLIAQPVKNLPAMQETLVWFLGWENPLEKEMATNSSILTWRIPWTGEPGSLQSGITRVGHDLVTKPPPPTPVFCPGEFCRQRSLMGYSPWGHKESDTTEWLSLSLYFQSLFYITADKGFLPIKNQKKWEDAK